MARRAQAVIQQYYYCSRALKLRANLTLMTLPVDEYYLTKFVLLSRG